MGGRLNSGRQWLRAKDGNRGDGGLRRQCGDGSRRRTAADLGRAGRFYWQLVTATATTGVVAAAEMSSGGGGAIFFIIFGILFFSRFFLFHAVGLSVRIRKSRMRLRWLHAKITIFADLFTHAASSTTCENACCPYANTGFVVVFLGGKVYLICT